MARVTPSSGTFPSGDGAFYARYRKGSAWADVASLWLADEARATGQPPRCAVCGLTFVELHHACYSRAGAERHDDLVALCPAHHRALHELWAVHPAWRQVARREATVGIIAQLRRGRPGCGRPDSGAA